jgi:hypothetical protein
MSLESTTWVVCWRAFVIFRASTSFTKEESTCIRMKSVRILGKKSRPGVVEEPGRYSKRSVASSTMPSLVIRDRQPVLFLPSLEGL